MKQAISLVLVIMLLTGCGIIPMSDRDRTVTETALLGGASGAALGAWLGKELADNAVAGGIIGWGLGTFAGAAYGNHIANKKEAFANQEAYLDACIAEATNINKTTRQYNAQLASEIQDMEEKMNDLLHQYQQGNLKKAELQQEKTYIETRLKEAVRKLQRASDELLIQKEVRRREANASEQKLDEMDAEIAGLEQSVKELSGTVSALAAIDQRLRV